MRTRSAFEPEQFFHRCAKNLGNIHSQLQRRVIPPILKVYNND